MLCWNRLVLCSLGVLHCLAEQQEAVVRNDGNKVYKVFPGSINHLSDIFVEMGLDVWNHPMHDEDVIVMVTPDQVAAFTKYLDQHRISSELIIQDVEQYIENEQKKPNHRTKREEKSLLAQISTDYLSFKKILSFVSNVKNAKKKNADVDLINYGKSSEGRALQAVKITRGNTCKPGILIDGGFHAREWISPATVLRFIYELVLNAANKDLVDKFDWYIIPVVNPDGYEYSRINKTTRMWRKTRNVNPNSPFRGTDPNRNFPYHWNPKAGGSKDPKSYVYAGPNPLSVPETAGLANFMKKHKDKLKMYLTFHSFGQQILYPYAYSQTSRAPDFVELTRVANVARAAMTAYSYGVGSSGPDLYIAAGGSDDYAKGELKIKYSYTFELPEKKSFILSPKKIPIVAADTWKGIKAMVLKLSTLPYAKKLPCNSNTTTAPTTAPQTTTRQSTMSLTTMTPNLLTTTPNLLISNLLTTYQPSKSQSTKRLSTTRLTTTRLPTAYRPFTSRSAMHLTSTHLLTTRLPTSFRPSIRRSTTRLPTTYRPSIRRSTTRLTSTRRSITRLPTAYRPSTSPLTMHLTSTHMPTTRLPTTRLPTTRLPTTRLPTTRLPTTRLPTTRMPTTRMPTTRMPTTRQPTTSKRKNRSRIHLCYVCLTNCLQRFCKLY